jgi:hypothetical protein
MPANRGRRGVIGGPARRRDERNPGRVRGAEEGGRRGAPAVWADRPVTSSAATTPPFRTAPPTAARPPTLTPPASATPDSPSTSTRHRSEARWQRGSDAAPWPGRRNAGELKCRPAATSRAAPSIRGGHPGVIGEARALGQVARSAGGSGRRGKGERGAYNAPLGDRYTASAAARDSATHAPSTARLTCTPRSTVSSVARTKV